GVVVPARRALRRPLAPRACPHAAWHVEGCPGGGFCPLPGDVCPGFPRAMTAVPGHIVVIGSANVDFTVKVERLPQAGETVSGGDFRLSCGGKGANQALAAHLAGAPVFMIAKLGRDPNGELVYRHLLAAGLSPNGLLRDAEVPSGVALIIVDAQGDNVIAVAPG